MAAPRDPDVALSEQGMRADPPAQLIGRAHAQFRQSGFPPFTKLVVHDPEFPRITPQIEASGKACRPPPGQHVSHRGAEL